MKKSLSCAVAFIFASTAAHAQSSVTLYGIVDGGLLYQNKSGGPGLGGPTANRLLVFNSGGNTNNRWGIRVLEDLGGGIADGAQLENQFTLGTGALSSPGNMFSYANVFVRSSFGQVTAGRQLDPAYLAYAKADPRDLKQALSAAGYWNFLQGKSTAPSVTAYETNALSYLFRSKEIFVGVLYHFGNEPGSLSQGRTISVGATYQGTNLLGEAAFVQKNDSSGTRDLRVWSLGGGYKIGSATLKAAWTDFDQPQGNAISFFPVTGPSDIRVIQAGLNYDITPSYKFTFAYYWAEDRKNTSNATSTYVLSQDYLLSKSTNLYAYVGLTNAKQGANGMTSLMTAALTSGVPGTNTIAVGIGIQHNFFTN